jgi:DNA-binding NtrC family response regulator
MLTLDGHQVGAAGTVADARALLAKQSFDAVLCDVRMPGTDGPEFFRELQQGHPALARHFVVMTGDSLSADTRERLERMAAPLLPKPFQLDDVRRVLARVLEAP